MRKRTLHYLSVFIACLLLAVGCRSAGAKEYPRRIVSLGPINTENVYLLDAGDRLIANTRYCVRPEAAKKKEKIGSVMQVSIEKIISLQPDLVLATGLTQPAQIRKLRELGLRVVQFNHPKSFADICVQLLRLGRLLGREQRAGEFVARAKKEVAAIRQRVDGRERPRVFLQVGAEPLFGSAPGSFTHDFIEFGGGTNILSDQSSGAASLEKVLARNPDIILIAIMGSETGVAGREKARWELFGAIRAVRDHRVHIVNPNLVCSPSPATFVRALRLIAGLIHPEIFQEKNHANL
jgi:iron complex transport system substrate-binding protein